MEELFRFIQQAFVISEPGRPIDLATESDFQKQLRDLVGGGQPYSQVRAAAAKLLDDVFDNGGNSQNAVNDQNGGSYRESLQRARQYDHLHDTLLAMTTVTVDNVNQTVKDTFGEYASELVKTTQFQTDKTVASDVLVAVKLVTRFDHVDVAAITTMRRVIAFIEDLAAGRVPTGWHPLQLAEPSNAAIDGGVAAVTRTPTDMSVWWIGKDGSVQTAQWTDTKGWIDPAAVAGPRSAAPSSGLAAVSRSADDMQVWWVADDGSVHTAAWTETHEWGEPVEVAGPHSAATSSGLAALSRSASDVLVWWIGEDGALHNAWQINGGDWQVSQLADPHSASTASGIAVLSRSATHMEVWWVGETGEVSGAWWIQGDGWHGPYTVAGPHSAAKSSGVGAVTRTSTDMDVWWVGESGEVLDAHWTKADGWHKPVQLAGAHSASTSSGIAALTRTSTHMLVWWIGEMGSVQGAQWTPDEWSPPATVAEANSASASSGLAALTRIATHMELWWVGKDAAVQDVWWLDAPTPGSPTDNLRVFLGRPLQIPANYLPPPPARRTVDNSPAEQGDDPHNDVVREHDALYEAYQTLMTARPAQLAITALGQPDAPHLAGPAEVVHDQAPAAGQSPAAASEQASAASTVLGVASATLQSMDAVVTDHLRAQLGDPATASLHDVLDVVKRRWLAVSSQVEPARVPAPARIFRLGTNLFAVQDSGARQLHLAQDELPDFSHAVIRPVGIGDLQIVRQTLIGYEPADISHIENALPGELMRRTILREETSELVITDETETTQSQERDTQTTDRNELVAESQKEAGQQSSTTTDQTSTSSYGRLVENSKTNYARSVTDRAVNTLTQTVRQQRVQRERKFLSDRAFHQLDNSAGQKTVRGIYQWVDKTYQVQVLNYGKRLLYDVVIPEPAAFLIDALKNAAQPENFQLTKPVEPTLSPSDLTAANYALWAAQYGVTGSVTPPPVELTTTFANTNADVAGGSMDGYGNKYNDKQFFSHFTIQVPDGYTAIGGYIQRTNLRFDKATAAPDQRWLEFFIGENTFKRFSTNDDLNYSFTLNGETGQIPVTMRTFSPTLQFNYAVGINCRRTDNAYEQWQLKTHSVIVAGYQRQRTNYLDELSKYQAAVRTQMALAHGFSRDSTMERQELKKAFLNLLMSEHFSDVYFPTPDPTAFPPDPEYVKKWGAVTAFFERAFEWEHLMYLYYPYFWGRRAKWGELILIQDLDPAFEAFLTAGAARVVVPVRPGFENALAHYHETGDVWMGEEIPDMFSEQYVSIVAEIKARNAEPGNEVCVAEWEVRLPTTLVMAREDNELPSWPKVSSTPAPDA
ncbi:hypothetical protein [Mycobacterium sp. MMS18-G62]